MSDVEEDDVLSELPSADPFRATEIQEVTTCFWVCIIGRLGNVANCLENLLSGGSQGDCLSGKSGNLEMSEN